MEAYSACAHVGHVKLIHRHKARNHVEVSLVVGHDETCRQFLHDGRGRYQCIGAGAEANNHDFASIAGIFDRFGNHSRNAHTLKHHVWGAARRFLQFGQDVTGRAGSKPNICAKACGALSTELFGLSDGNVVSAHKTAPERHGQAHRAGSQNQHPFAADIGTHIDGVQTHGKGFDEGAFHPVDAIGQQYGVAGVQRHVFGESP